MSEWITLSTCLPASRADLVGWEIRYLLQNMDWLEEELGGFDDDYLVFDCPGKSSVMP